jgi:hypothetical protein
VIWEGGPWGSWRQGWRERAHAGRTRVWRWGARATLTSCTLCTTTTTQTIIHENTFRSANVCSRCKFFCRRTTSRNTLDMHNCHRRTAHNPASSPPPPTPSSMLQACAPMSHAHTNIKSYHHSAMSGGHPDSKKMRTRAADSAETFIKVRSTRWRPGAGQKDTALSNWTNKASNSA